MKVLFLDFDGVLNSYKDRNFGREFSKAPCENLNTLLERIKDLKIVISSAWRHLGLEECKEVLKENGINTDRVIDITGDERGERGHQIQCWLDRNPGVTGMAIVDDESDMADLKSKLVKTNGFIGLTSKHVDEIVETLDKPMNK
ncbi:MAG: HAD domain-containing protein [Candidatus Methanoperedens sp.]|nr:HAD domain-containing protein [Candidatus Methanoperedens sp.]